MTILPFLRFAPFAAARCLCLAAALVFAAAPTADPAREPQAANAGGAMDGGARVGVATEEWSLVGDHEVGDVRCSTHAAIRPPRGEFDRIEVVRCRSAAPPEAVLLYLPGTFMNGDLVLRDERYDLRLYLAGRGIDVFSLNYRTHAVPPEDDSAMPRDLGFMAGWDLATFVGDARAAAAEARRAGGKERIFVAGFSRGAALAYALASAEPEAVAGIVALDGYFKEHDLAGSPRGDIVAETARLAKEGAWVSDVGGSRGWSARQRLMQAAAEDPAGPALGIDGSVGAQLSGVLYHAWGPGVLANPLQGPAGGDGASSVQVLARAMAAYDRFYPRIQEVESEAFAAMADDPRTGLDDGWPQLRRPVLFFGSTGMGPQFLMHGIASAAHCSGEETEIHVLEGHGHLDVLFGEEARERVFETTRRWILRQREVPAAGGDTSEASP